MINISYVFVFFNIYIFFKISTCEIFPFFVYADENFVKCSDGKLESFNSTQNILPKCIQATQIERIDVFQLFIQCPDARVHFELNRTFPSNAPSSEYSLTSLYPHCFLEQIHHNHFIPYQTRYIAENETFTQIISFQCDSSNLTNQRWKFNEQFYLYFKLMNYGLCRYLVQLIYSDGKCNRFYQQTYRIQLQIKHSVCYYQLGLQISDNSLEYFDQLIRTNLSVNSQSISSKTSANHSIIIIIFTTSMTGISLFLCSIIFILMYRFNRFRR
ncbi:hypothetical protein I4U23_028779 [Adineta vaga]|nr:hypothetical protein I4U23_028779 [Adineta vaga]